MIDVRELVHQKAMPEDTGWPRSGCFVAMIRSGIEVATGEVLSLGDNIRINALSRAMPGWDGRPILVWQDFHNRLLRCTDPGAFGQMICDYINPGRWRFAQTGGWDTHDGGPCAYPYPWAPKTPNGFRFMGKYWNRPGKATGHYTLLFPEFGVHWNPDLSVALAPSADWRVFDIWEVGTK